MTERTMPKEFLIQEGLSDYYDDPQGNGGLPDPVYSGDLTRAIMSRVEGTDLTPLLSEYSNEEGPSDVQISAEVAEGLVRGFARVFDLCNQGYITNGHMEAASIACAKGDPYIAEKLWVGSGGPWAEQVGCDSESEPQAVIERARQFYPCVNRIADFVIGHAVAANKGIEYTHSITHWTAPEGDYSAVNRYKIV